MELLWTEKFTGENIWEPNFRGHLIKWNNQPIFMFRKERQLAGIVIGPNGMSNAMILTPNVSVAIPRNWMFFENYLMCDEKCCIDLNSMQKCKEIPKNVQLEFFDKAVKNEKHFINDAYVFGEYTISHRGEFGYQCKHNSDVVWNFTGQGYLHTDILRFDNCIVFGTDGRGGHFYILELSSGKILCDINTHGTNHYAFENDTFYILSQEKQSVVKSISIRSGIIIDEISLKGKIDSNSRILQYKKNILTTTFQYSAGVPKSVLFNFIRM